MFDYSFTDEETVARIADVAPRAMSSYFIVLHKCENSSEIIISRDQIMNDHQKSWTKFKNDLRQLAHMFIINLLDKGEHVLVSLICMEECA